MKKHLKCLVCKNLVVENTYHRALNFGAVWYCGKCDMHLDKNLKAVRITCACCGFDDNRKALVYNAKIIVKNILK